MTDFRTNKDGKAHPIGQPAGTTMSSYLFLVSQDARRRDVLVKKHAETRNMLNAAAQAKDLEMQEKWSSMGKKGQENLLRETFSGYTDNYHGGMLGSYWIELPPAIRAEILSRISKPTSARAWFENQDQRSRQTILDRAISYYGGTPNAFMSTPDNFEDLGGYRQSILQSYLRRMGYIHHSY